MGQAKLGLFKCFYPSYMDHCFNVFLPLYLSFKLGLYIWTIVLMGQAKLGPLFLPIFRPYSSSLPVCSPIDAAWDHICHFCDQNEGCLKHDDHASVRRTIACYRRTKTTTPETRTTTSYRRSQTTAPETKRILSKYKNAAP